MRSIDNWDWDIYYSIFTENNQGNVIIMFSSSISSIFGKKDVSKEDLSVYYNNNNPNNEANAYNPNSPVTLRGTFVTNI